MRHTLRERAAALAAALVALALCHPQREARAQADLFAELKTVPPAWYDVAKAFFG